MATMMLVAAGVALAVTLTEGDDVCTGTAANDQFALGGGNDTCNGLGGADEIFGDQGNDDLVGSSGGDALFGGTGTDTVDGGFGNDFINVSDHLSGNDEVVCGPGTDRLVKDAGDFSTGCDRNVTVVPVP